MDSREILKTLDAAVQETRDGQYLRAIERFESCLEDPDIELPEAKRRSLRSYYGVCVAMVWGRTTGPSQWCREALEGGPAHADLHYNMAMVLLRANQRQEAISYLSKGQRLDPEHAGINATFQRLTPRRRPLLTFLGRRHPINRYWGMVRTRMLGT